MKAYTFKDDYKEENIGSLLQSIILCKEDCGVLEKFPELSVKIIRQGDRQFVFGINDFELTCRSLDAESGRYVIDSIKREKK